MNDSDSIKKQLQAIQQRNKKVEKDKEWEISWTRRIAIACTTYILISIVMYSIDVERPFLNAIIPAVAYLISTATLTLIKSWWMNR